MSQEPDPDVFHSDLPETTATRMRSLEGIGTYAVSIEWEDGHAYGIYNWHYLRALCPCAECQAKREEISQ